MFKQINILVIKISKILITKRFELLAAALLIHVAINATNGIWVDDFWEHSANVREFMHRPFNTKHPLFEVTTPHSYLNPYAYLVALIGQLIGLDSINALALFSVINFAILCCGLKLFISTINKDKAGDISFYSLIFILFLWGKDPWTYSGFFNFQALLYVLPLPSAFIFGLSLVCIKINDVRYKTPSTRYTLLIILLLSLALLAHPLTAIFLVSVLIGQAITQNKSIRKTIEISIIIIMSFVLAELWPYFSIIKIMTNSGSVYHNANEILYDGIIERIWPIALITPFMIKELRENKNRAIVISMVLLSAIYLYGYAEKKYSYGRSISFIVMMLQIIFAEKIVNKENWVTQKLPNLINNIKILLIILLIILGANGIASDIRRSLTIANGLWKLRPITNEITYKDFTFLRTMIHQDDVVIANLDNSYIIPSFGGKVIGIQLPVAFLDDIELRRQNINKFFSCESREGDRNEVIKTYTPKYLLLDKMTDQCIDELLKQINAKIKYLKYENDRFLLYYLE